MKILKLLLIGLFVLIGARMNDQNLNGQELLNADFSAVKGDLPEHWSLMDHDTGCEKTADGIRLTVLKEDGPFDGSFGQTINLKENGIHLKLSANIQTEVAQMAYLQIKLYKKHKEIRRISSPGAAAGASDLKIVFTTDEADALQVIFRLSRRGHVGKSAIFSNIQLTKIKPGSIACWAVKEGKAELEYGERSFRADLRRADGSQFVVSQTIPADSDLIRGGSSAKNNQKELEFSVRTCCDYIGFVHLEADLYKEGKMIGKAEDLSVERVNNMTKSSNKKAAENRSISLNGDSAESGTRPLRSAQNRWPVDRLRLKFDPKNADRLELRICFDGAEFRNGERAVCTDFYIGPYRNGLPEFEQKKTRLEIVPGYRVCSLYLHECRTEKESDFQSVLQYRKEGESQWRTALSPVYLPNQRCARGSLLNLDENTSYQLRFDFTDGGQKKSVRKSFRTLNVHVPVVRTIELTPDNFRKINEMIPQEYFYQENWESELDPVNKVSEQKPKGYLRFVSKPGTVLDGGDDFPAAIHLQNVQNIILEGLTVRGGKVDAIRLNQARNIQIINCDIAGFGMIGERRVDLDGKYYLKENARRALNNNAGIHVIECDSVLIERNYIHDPRGTANSWFYSHPAGPNAVFIGGTTGAALRFNDFIGSDRKRWNDTVECESGNGSNRGSVYRDGEVCGNYFGFGNDDGMELDGGQINCRFFLNRTEGHLCGVSTAPCRKGPSYLYQNIFCNQGDEYGLVGAGIKNVYGNLGLGRMFFFNNTTVGYGTGFSGCGGEREEYEPLKGKNFLKAVARNNISVTGSCVSSSLYTILKCDFDYDLFYHARKESKKEFIALKEAGLEEHGIHASPDFLDANSGRYELKKGSPGYESGVSAAGLFNDEKINFGAFQKNGPVSIPMRPIPFYTDSMTVRLDASGDQADSKKVTVLIDGGDFSDDFSVLCPESAPFFKVTPNTGRLFSGKPVVLTVSSVPEKIDQARRNSSAFIIRTSKGYSRPVSVLVDSRENKNLIEKMRIGAVYAASIQENSLPKKNSLTKAEKKQKEHGAKTASVVFDVPKEGEYWLFVKASGKVRSLVLDNGEAIKRMPIGSHLTENAWYNIGSIVYSGDVNHPFKLTAGRHVFQLSTGTGERCSVKAAALCEDPDAFRLCP